MPDAYTSNHYEVAVQRDCLPVVISNKRASRMGSYFKLKEGKIEFI